MEKTIGQIIDEINEMNDGGIMEIYKVSNGFKTKHKSGWSHSADEFIKENKTKPLFITEDGVQMFDRDSIVWRVRNNTLEKIKIHSIHLNECDFEHKVFAHESNADEYIWRNKRVFSYEDIFSYLPTGGDIGVFEQLAKERSM